MQTNPQKETSVSLECTRSHRYKNVLMLLLPQGHVCQTRCIMGSSWMATPSTVLTTHYISYHIAAAAAAAHLAEQTVVLQSQQQALYMI